MAALFQRFGALGVVTDAPNRDLSGIRALSPGFHVFGAGSVASHGNGAILDVDIPVEVGGLRIRPGDIIHADLNGVISVPAAIASTIPEEAAEVLEMERGLRDMIADERTSTEAIRERFASRAKV